MSTTTTTMSHSASNHRGAIRDAQGPLSFPEHQDQHREASESANMPEVVVLAAQSGHKDRHTCLVYNALATVVLSRLPVTDWQEYDYIYLAVIALALENSLLPVEALAWDPASEWRREKDATSKAMTAHINHERKLADESTDEDFQSQVENDTYSLFAMLRLGEREKPVRDGEGPTPLPEPLDQLREASELVLAAESRHEDRRACFVYNALAAVVLSRLPVADWKENDYIYLAVIALALENSLLPVEALVWDPASEGRREKDATAKAMIAHIHHERKLAEESTDEDFRSEVANDTHYLSGMLRLGEKENPLVPVGVDV